MSVLTLALVLGLMGGASTGQPATETKPQGEAAAGTPYHVITTWPVGGDGGWDCLVADSESHRLFVPRGTRVMVIDTESGKQVGEIPGTEGVHAVALATDLGKGFTTNGRSNTATVFDLKTLKTIGTVKTGTNPDTALYLPGSKRVVAFNGRSKDATVINAEDLSVVGTISLAGKPEFAAADERGRVYVNLEDTGEIARLDIAGLKVEERWPLAPGKEPTGLAIDPSHHLLFAACANEMMAVVDADSGKVLATPKIGKGPDGAGFDAAGGFALSSNGEGTLSVVAVGEGAERFRVVQTLSTAPRARTMALDGKTRRIYLPTAEFEAPKEGERRPAMKPGTFRIVVVGP